MKHILMLATGGTIACRQTGHGLAPALTGEELLEFVPQLQHICKVTINNPMSVDSTDMTVEHRMCIARIIWDNRDCYDGFVITHGTDTLAHTATLFSHVLRNFPKPVILTGAQRPVGAEDSDAEGNLLSAFRVACEDYRGVAAVVHGQVIRGTRIVKVDSR
ncbi:MAG: asparaginase domain-containing protein, partial [Intestinibacillus sp.]